VVATAQVRATPIIAHHSQITLFSRVTRPLPIP